MYNTIEQVMKDTGCTREEAKNRLYMIHYGGSPGVLFNYAFSSPKNLNIPKLEAKSYSKQSQSAMELGRRIHEAELTWKNEYQNIPYDPPYDLHGGGRWNKIPEPKQEPKMNQNDFSNDLEAVVRGLHGLSKHAVEAKNDVIKKMQSEIDTLKQQLNIQQSETGNRAEGERYWQNQAENARRNERKIYQDNEQLEEILATLQVDIMMHLNKET